MYLGTRKAIFLRVTPLHLAPQTEPRRAARRQQLWLPGTPGTSWCGPGRLWCCPTHTPLCTAHFSSVVFPPSPRFSPLVNPGFSHPSPVNACVSLEPQLSHNIHEPYRLGDTHARPTGYESTKAQKCQDFPLPVRVLKQSLAGEDFHCSDLVWTAVQQRGKGSQETAAWVSFAMILFLILPRRGPGVGCSQHQFLFCPCLYSDRFIS